MLTEQDLRECQKQAGMKLILPGSIRSKKNSKRIVCKRGNPIVLPSKAYQRWEEEVRWDVKCQLPRAIFVPITGKLHVCVTAYYKGPRPDLSGALESVGDCLEGLVWANDRQIESWDGSRLVHDKENPRTEVSVKDEKS